MPIEMPRRVRKTYTRERSHFPRPAPMYKLVVYIRADQAVWLAEEEERRLARNKGRRVAAPLPAKAVLDHPDDAVPPVIERKGRSGKYSEMTREGIDLLIEYARHAEFMDTKLRSGSRAGDKAGGAK